MYDLQSGDTIGGTLGRAIRGPNVRAKEALINQVDCSDLPERQR